MASDKMYDAVLPPVPRTEDRQTLQFFAAIKQALDEIKNKTQISSQGVVARSGTAAASDNLVAALAGEIQEDPFKFVAPPPVVNVQADGVIENILISWELSGRAAEVYEVWRSASDDFGQAELLGSTQFLLFVDVVQPNSTYYYWVRGVSSGGVEGPFQGTEGVLGQTIEDPITKLAEVSGGIKKSNLAQALLEDIPGIAGVPELQTDFTNQVNAVDNTVDSLYTLRVNNNGRVTGFGLSNDGTESSFGVLADRFFVVNQDNNGETVTPFVVQNGEVYINTATIRDASITDAKIGSISANKISTTNLSAFSADLGYITAGRLRGPSGKVDFDLNNETLIVKDEFNVVRVKIGKL